ncbi:MAG: class I SAM-dependent methyltransferase [Methanomassiliicoccus sp.]|nr:MAG: class I SAM-dependent methyltransferase [Methanomassiliicoccus sp.]
MTISPIDIKTIAELDRRPAIFEKGETVFWEHPHISKMMLMAHLDQSTGAASRRFDEIDRSVEWIDGILKKAGARTILDLGCGPGLYAKRLAARGYEVLGVDISPNSIAYANEDRDGLDNLQYTVANYLELNLDRRFDAVLLIYGDLCALSDVNMSALLGKVFGWLNPEGHFIFDTMKTELIGELSEQEWHGGEFGFWRDGPHLVLQRRYDFLDHPASVNQYIVLEAGEDPVVYRVWFNYIDEKRARSLIDEHGFETLGIWSDLKGTPVGGNDQWMGVLARKEL